MDSTPSATIPRKEDASAAEHLLVFPPFGGNVRYVLTSQYRAFGFDNRVARLNYDIDWLRDWPEPYLFSKLIRCIGCPVKRCWLVTKKALSYLNRYVREHICVSYLGRHSEADFEMGERVGQEEAEATEQTILESPVKHKFRKSLQMVFSNTDDVVWIMERVNG